MYDVIFSLNQHINLSPGFVTLTFRPSGLSCTDTINSQCFLNLFYMVKANIFEGNPSPSYNVLRLNIKKYTKKQS